MNSNNYYIIGLVIFLMLSILSFMSVTLGPINLNDLSLFFGVGTGLCAGWLIKTNYQK